MDDLPIWGFVGEFVEAQEETADMPKADESVRAEAPEPVPASMAWNPHARAAGVHLHAQELRHQLQQ